MPCFNYCSARIHFYKCIYGHNVGHSEILETGLFSLNIIKSTSHLQKKKKQIFRLFPVVLTRVPVKKKKKER